MFPGCVILKNDSGYLQGIPDLLVLHRDRWGMLEVKVEADYKIEPNQDVYVEMLDEMSFAAFIHPSNEQDVLRDLERALTARGHTRLSERQ